MTEISELKERADEAKMILEAQAFTVSVRALRQHWHDQMMLDGLTTERILELRAMMKALEAIPQELKTRIGDYKMGLRNAA